MLAFGARRLVEAVPGQIVRIMGVYHPLELLYGVFPPPLLVFEAVFADRKGDIYLLQDKRADAISEYAKAWKSLEEGVEYRRLVEVKLGALGAPVQGSVVAAAGSAEGVK